MDNLIKYWDGKQTYVEYDCEKHGHIKQRASRYKIYGCPKCHRENRGKLYGVAITPYKSTIGNKLAYHVWMQMLQRCYGESYQRKEPSYKNKVVCDDWLNFEFFLEWFNDNYIDGFELDKDILKKNNTIYSQQTCCFVPKEINNTFVNRHRRVNGLPSGVHYDKERNKYSSHIKRNGKLVSLGRHKTVEDAFLAYKEAKEQKIKTLAIKYKNKLKESVYNALMNYKVEITD